MKQVWFVFLKLNYNDYESRFVFLNIRVLWHVAYKRSRVIQYVLGIWVFLQFDHIQGYY